MLKRTQKLLIYNRLFVTVLLILIQAGWLVLFFRHLYSLAGVSLAISLLAMAFSLYVVGRDENPALKIGWLILILAFPFFGVPFFLFFGGNKPTRRTRDKIDGVHTRLTPLLCQEDEPMRQLCQQDHRAAATSRYIGQIGGYPVWRDTQVTYYPIGEAMFKGMLEAVESAKRFIFLEFFIIEPGIMWNTLLEALVRKAREGVQVRIIFDDFGSVLKLPPHYNKKLEAMHPNIHAMAFNRVVPFFAMVMNNRDHRKILVIDGDVGFNGGVNLADEYINEKVIHGHWKDTGVRLEGPAVWSLTAMFLEMWNAFYGPDEFFTPFVPTAKRACEGFVQPYGDGPFNGEYLGENVYIDILARAQRYVYITTPYLILDNELRVALCNAAKRGVDVRIITPGIPDKKIVFRLTRANYRPLLAAGVKIYEYTPGFIHAKSMVSDDTTGVVGSINLDYRSLYLHFECSTYFYGCPAVAQLRGDVEQTLAVSARVFWEQLRPGFWGSALDACLRTFETLF